MDTKIDREMEGIIENAVELASDCLTRLQDRYQSVGIGRNVLIQRFIIPWAVEAEARYREMVARDEYVPYYDFIEDFGKEKLKAEIGG